VEAPPDRRRLAALIAAASTRAPSENDPLAASMLAHCWPGGMGDRSEPIALAWLLRWRPMRLQTPTYDCGCLRGHCAICN
jgi:hypothetical protein